MVIAKIEPAYTRLIFLNKIFTYIKCVKKTDVLYLFILKLIYLKAQSLGIASFR
jgi:hypothetical protein